VIRLARMRWWHVAELLPVERELFAPEPWSEALFWSELGQLDTRHYLVALDGDAVVGWAGLCDYPDEALVQTLAVAPAVQGRGVGAQLLVALLEEAGRRGQRTVSLEVRSDNAPAQRLYDRHGFTRTAVRRGYYAGGVDALVLTRRA
jgi:ribosomal-protein-alanine N-acetyltransferase